MLLCDKMEEAVISVRGNVSLTKPTRDLTHIIPYGKTKDNWVMIFFPFTVNLHTVGYEYVYLNHGQSSATINLKSL